MTAATVAPLLCLSRVAGTSALCAFLNDPGVQRDRRPRMRSPASRLTPSTALTTTRSLGSDAVLAGSRAPRLDARRRVCLCSPRSRFLPLLGRAGPIDRDRIWPPVLSERMES
jgi:hypothetical protein